VEVRLLQLIDPDPIDPEKPIVPAATKNSRKYIAPFTQALMFETSPDRFDRWSGSACRLGFGSREPTWRCLPWSAG
jgi:hypothetical protein